MTYSESIKIDLKLPFWSYRSLFPEQECSFLLDSALDSERLGKYSFIGGSPAVLLTAARQPLAKMPAELLLITKTTWTTTDGTHSTVPKIENYSQDPFTALRELQAAYAPHPRPEQHDNSAFGCGLVGYFGYETGYTIEELPDTGIDDLKLPELAFFMVDEVLSFCHQTGAAKLNIIGRGTNLVAAKANAAEKKKNWLARIATFEAGDSTGPTSEPTSEPKSIKSTEIRAFFDRPAYCQEVQRCRDHILNGDIFEICLTHRLEMPQPTDAWSIYCHLRAINPAPFASFLNFPDFQIVSASPERFLKLGADKIAESRPIKGTRPRGDNLELDQLLREDLATAEKDRAENLMIVDLVRNDLGRVAEIGSVHVPELLAIESYATVFQLVSTVQAKLRAELDAFDLVRSCFPGGSMTGAPKIEAMKIIDDIEPVKRGVYSGAIGYFSHSGEMDLSIVIRTIVCKDNRCTFSVGGAIVLDSDPDAEYTETMDKAKALIQAITLAGQQS